MANISALLDALKQKEGSGGLPVDSGEADAPDADTSDSEQEDSPEDDAEDNAKIVAVLQQDYPTIYAKISKQVEAEDSAPSSSNSPDDAEMGDMSDMMSS